MTTNNKPACETCLFWDTKGEVTRAAPCRVDGPQVTNLDSPLGAWPWTEAKDWCGRFKLRPELRPKPEPKVRM